MYSLPRTAIIGKTAREIFSHDLAEMVELGDKGVLEGIEQVEPVIYTIETPQGRRLHAVAESNHVHD